MEEALLQARELDEARQASGFDQVALDATARLGFANGAFEDSDEETGPSPRSSSRSQFLNRHLRALLQQSPQLRRNQPCRHC